MVKDTLVSLALLMIFLVPGAVFGGGYPTVVITDAPDGGLVMAPITESALRIVNNGFSDERFTPSVIAEDGSAVPSQYVDGRLLLMDKRKSPFRRRRTGSVILRTRRAVFPAESNSSRRAAYWSAFHGTIG